MDHNNIDAPPVNKPLSDEEKSSLNIAHHNTVDIEPKGWFAAFSAFFNANESSYIKLSYEQEQNVEDCINSTLVYVADTKSSEPLIHQDIECCEESNVNIKEEINLNQLETTRSLSNYKTIEITKDSKNTPCGVSSVSLMLEAIDSEVDRETEKQAVSTKSRHEINNQSNLVSCKNDSVSSNLDVSATESTLSSYEVQTTEESHKSDTNVPLVASANLKDIDCNDQIMDESSLDKNELCTENLDEDATEVTKDSTVPDIVIDEENKDETISAKSDEDNNAIDIIVSPDVSKSKIIEVYSAHLNPFMDDKDDTNNKLINEQVKSHQSKSDRLSSKYNKSLNPFEESDEDEEESRPQVSVRRKSEKKSPWTIIINSSKSFSNSDGRKRKKVLATPSLNPFSSDEDSEEEKSSLRVLIPTARSRLYIEHSSLSVSQQSFMDRLLHCLKEKTPAAKPLGTIGVPQRRISLPEVVSQLTSPSLSLSHISPRLRKRMSALHHRQ